MAWKIFNIGKANAEIERLTAELAAAKVPAADATQLADAIASNDQISSQLAQANTELATAKTAIGAANAATEKAQNEVNSIGVQLKAACASLKLQIKEGASSVEMITALQDGVSATLAKLNVPAANIPAAKAASKPGVESNVKNRADFMAMTPKDQLAFTKAGGKITD